MEATSYPADTTFLYDNGLPFSSKLAENLDRIIDRVDNNKAALVVIWGGVGEGKTTLMAQCINYVNWRLGWGKVDLTKDGPQFAKGGSEFLRKIRLCHEHKLPCIGYDEAGDFNRRGALTAFNAMLNRTFETFRALKCIVFMTLPHMLCLDSDIFDKNIPRLGIRCRDRNKEYGNFDGYSLYRMQLLRQRMLKLGYMKNYAYSTVRRNFRGHFKNLPPDDCRQLDRTSTDYKLEILRASEVKIDGLMTYPEMAIKLMKSISWVRNSTNALKLKPARVIKSIKYFTPETLAVLSNHLDEMSENPKQRGRPKK